MCIASMQHICKLIPMKIHSWAKTINVHTLDGKREKRTIFMFKGAKVSVNDKNKDKDNAALETYKKYLNNRK